MVKFYDLQTITALHVFNHYKDGKWWMIFG